MGQVETYDIKTTKWKRVKSSNWTMQDANVVCKEAGHGKALEYINETDYSRRVVMDGTLFPDETLDVYEWQPSCNGSEYSILRCALREQKSVNDATNRVGVGVRCQTPGKKF